MKDQRGSAVAIVLMLLAAAGLLGAGLMLQSQLNNKMTAAKSGLNQSLNLADGAARLAFQEIGKQTTELIESSLTAKTYEDYASSPESLGAWVAKRTMRGLAGSGAAAPGDEEGGYSPTHIQLWLAEGVGNRGTGWVSGKGYVEDALVTRGGSTFRCLMNHTASSNDEPGKGPGWTARWELVAPAQTIVQLAVRLKSSD